MSKSIAQMQRSGKSIEKVGTQIRQTGKSIEQSGKSLTAKATLPLIGLGVAAVSASNDLDNAVAKVSTVADMSATSINVLRDETLGLSNDVGVSASAISEAQYQAISAGVETTKSIGFVETAVKAAKGGFTDAATAVDGLTTVLNSYGMESSNAEKVSNQMMVAQNYGKTTFGDMAASMGKVIPIASSLNVSTDELFGSVAALTKSGIGTSEAMTGLKAAYSNILKPSSAACDTAKQLGIDFSDAHLKSVGWAKFLEEIKDKVGNNSSAMAQLFGSTEALNSVMVLTGKGSESFSEAMNLMENSTGATQTAYEKMITPQEKMNIATNKCKNAFIKVGEALTPIFSKIAECIDHLGTRLNGLSDEQINTMLKFAGMIAAIGPTIMIFGKMVKTIGTVTRTFGKVKGAIGKAGGALKLLSSPCAIAVIAVAGIAIAAFLIIKNWKKVQSFLVKLGKRMKKVFSAMGLSSKKFQKTFNKCKNGVLKIVGAIKKAFGAMKKWIVDHMDQIKMVCGAIVDILIAILGVWLERIRIVIDTVVDVIGGVWTFLSGVFTGNWKKAWKGIVDIVKSLFGGIVGFVKAPINAVINLINGALSGINKVMNFKLPSWIPGIGGKSFGFEIPKIPELYTGTKNWGGGAAMIHDKGAEIVDLPTGSRVYPHDKSMAMAREEGRANGGRSVNVTIPKLADNIVIRNEKDIDMFAERLARKLEQVCNNSGREVFA